MDDRELIQRINTLVDEEHHLYERGSDGLDTTERARLESLEIALDQCWDLLRQRRARRRAGLDPDDADLRDATTVERYQQ